MLLVISPLQQRGFAFDLTVDPAALTPVFCESAATPLQREPMDIQHKRCMRADISMMIWTAHEAIRIAHDYGLGIASQEEWDKAHFAYLCALGSFLVGSCVEEPLS